MDTPSQITPRISAIVALNKGDRAIGSDNDLLHRIPADLKRFKELTTGHPIIMGRKTYESIGRPLPHRTNIVITRDPVYGRNIEGLIVCSTVADALAEASHHPGNEEVFVIGGGEIYTQTLPFTHRLYLTLIDSNIPGTVFFPPYESEFIHIIDHEEHPEHTPAYEWITLER